MNSKETNKKYYESYWNENMIKYLSVSAGGRWFDHLLNLIFEKIDPKTIHYIADVGCGVGNKTAMMARYYKNAEVYGYDFSKSGILAARKSHKESNVTFRTGDITKTSHKKGYDLITAFDVLEHIDDWKKLTQQLIEVNNKYMLISSPVGKMRPYEVYIGHVRNFNEKEIESFMESQGYVTVKTFYAGFPFYSPILRNLTNIFYKDYSELPQAEMSFLSKRMHDVWYILFRYFSFKNKGDIFIGLFEKNSSKVK